MNEPIVLIKLDHNGKVYRPGETLAGEYRIESILPSEIKAIEVSILWSTEGKGDEDIAVHDFVRRSADEGDWIGMRPGRFETVLPRSPLTYEGVIVKIHWCVRVRVFPRHGREIVAESPFVLGEVDPVIFREES